MRIGQERGLLASKEIRFGVFVQREEAEQLMLYVAVTDSLAGQTAKPPCSPSPLPPQCNLPFRTPLPSFPYVKGRGHLDGSI